VFTFVKLMVKNLGRNKLRTTLTALSVTVLVTICLEMKGILGAVSKRVEAEGSQSRLMVSERWVIPSCIPIRYVRELTRIDGVEDWTTWNVLPGFWHEARQLNQQAVGIATRLENLTAMHTGLEKLDPAVIEALQHEKSGALVAADLAQDMHCQVGQEITLFGPGDADPRLRFRVVGVMPAGEYPRTIFFRQDYCAEATGNKDTISLVWLRARDPETGRRIAARITEAFRHRQPELKVETESASVARFAERGQSILALIQMVVAILVLDMIVVLANSISVATRERRVEMAVLKVLGFEPSALLFLVLGEATLVGALSGLLGAALAWGCSTLVLHEVIPPSGWTTIFTLFPVRATALVPGALLGAAVGCSGSILPAWSARKVKVADVFAKIA
jgi:putative ABC transport system permease protein